MLDDETPYAPNSGKLQDRIATSPVKFLGRRDVEVVKPPVKPSRE